MSVAISGNDFKHTVVDSEQTDVKGAAAQVKHQYIFLAVFLVQTVCNCSGSRLVDNSHYDQARNCSSILGGLSHLSLCIIEVSRYGNYGVSDFLAEIGLGGFLHLAQNHSRNFLWCKDLFALAGLDLNVRLIVFLDDREWEEFHIMLHSGI
ncbi:hypothetical protein ALC57_13699 [Trachymyrmex cornetzi]|uniref:Uncharacterized protein n=1 Tax=Trachymyrmex cornetzi TaxID=471704 RepID=A0A195DMJ0_9HYME|nr:hypothetical protein ALC57_13699 [Trachymyrmex cornetzi]